MVGVYSIIPNSFSSSVGISSSEAVDEREKPSPDDRRTRTGVGLREVEDVFVGHQRAGLASRNVEADTAAADRRRYVKDEEARVVKEGMKSGLNEAMEIATIWLDRYLAG